MLINSFNNKENEYKNLQNLQTLNWIPQENLMKNIDPGEVKHVINEYIEDVNNKSKVKEYEHYRDEMEKEFLIYDGIIEQFKNLISKKKGLINYDGM